jgi:hypothetical protein
MEEIEPSTSAMRLAPRKRGGKGKKKKEKGPPMFSFLTGSQILDRKKKAVLGKRRYATRAPAEKKKICFRTCLGVAGLGPQISFPAQARAKSRRMLQGRRCLQLH